MKVRLFVVLFILWNSMPAFSQAVKKEDPDAAAKKTQELVEEWFRRWNGLDGTAESVNRFLDLYEPNALHLSGPSEGQIGLVFYQGHKLIQKMAEDFSKTHSDIKYSIVMQTVKEKTAPLLSISTTPWGDAAAAVEFSGGYTENKKRFMVSGAVFFEFDGGKIRRLRLYYGAGEKFEVVGPLALQWAVRRVRS